MANPMYETYQGPRVVSFSAPTRTTAQAPYTTHTLALPQLLKNGRKWENLPTGACRVLHYEPTRAAFCDLEYRVENQASAGREGIYAAPDTREKYPRASSNCILRPGQTVTFGRDIMSIAVRLAPGEGYIDEQDEGTIINGTRTIYDEDSSIRIEGFANTSKLTPDVFGNVILSTGGDDFRPDSVSPKTLDSVRFPGLGKTTGSIFYVNSVGKLGSSWNIANPGMFIPRGLASKFRRALLHIKTRRTAAASRTTAQIVPFFNFSVNEGGAFTKRGVYLGNTLGDAAKGPWTTCVLNMGAPTDVMEGFAAVGSEAIMSVSDNTSAWQVEAWWVFDQGEPRAGIYVDSAVCAVPEVTTLGANEYASVFLPLNFGNTSFTGKYYNSGANNVTHVNHDPDRTPVDINNGTIGSGGFAMANKSTAVGAQGYAENGQIVWYTAVVSTLKNVFMRAA